MGNDNDFKRAQRLKALRYTVSQLAAAALISQHELISGCSCESAQLHVQMFRWGGVA